MRHLGLIALVLLFGSLAKAQHQELIIKESTKVYKKNNIQSGILTNLEKGQKVPISTRDYGAWVKIKVDLAGKDYYGWIPKKDIRGFRIRKVDREAITGKSLPYYKKRGLGVHTNMSFSSLGKEEFQTDDIGSETSNLTIEEASGTSIFFGFFYDHPFSSNQQLHIFASLRQHKVDGKVRINDDSNKNDLDLEQMFLAFGASLKNYSSKGAKRWWAYGLEIAKTNNMDLKVSTVDTKVPDKEFPFYVFPHISAGYDYRLSKKLYLIPEAKLNLAINTGTLTYAIDLKMALSYTF